MRVKIEFTSDDIRKLILAEMEKRIHGSFDEECVRVEVKSRQNYKAEWETAEYRATYGGDV